MTFGSFYVPRLTRSIGSIKIEDHSLECLGKVSITPSTGAIISFHLGICHFYLFPFFYQDWPQLGGGS